MYIPLNCVIVLEVYRVKREQNALIPTTMTELYTLLIRSLLLRHICSLPELEDQVTLESDDLRHLPPGIQAHFDNLAKLAYDGICNNQQIIFTRKEIPSGSETLSLMQSSMELFVDVGAAIFFISLFKNSWQLIIFQPSPKLNRLDVLSEMNMTIKKCYFVF